MAKEIKVLDVTLRDGGCVNDFNFGQIYMEKMMIDLKVPKGWGMCSTRELEMIAEEMICSQMMAALP